jgi:thiol-disulfide isomerase/thioredoxin
MKVKYLSTIAVVSILSFGAIAGYSNPGTAQKQISGVEATAQANPYASKANPYAAKSITVGSIGNPLAQELQGKPVVVDIYATWCSACQNIAPTLSQLKENYGGQVHFIVLDVTNRSTTAQAEANAARLGLRRFLAQNKSQTGMVTIIEPGTGKILAQYRNNANLADYQRVLNTALNQ